MASVSVPPGELHIRESVLLFRLGGRVDKTPARRAAELGSTIAFPMACFTSHTSGRVDKTSAWRAAELGSNIAFPVALVSRVIPVI